MSRTPKITCRRCGAIGPFRLLRRVAEVRDVMDDQGEYQAWAEWEFANELSGLWISCGSCGNTWATRRWFE